jgi:hypothetical protein
MNEPKPVDDPVKQLTSIPWWDAGIIRSLLTALGLLAGTVATLFFGVDEAAFNQKAEKLIGALVTFAVVAAPIGFAMWQRFQKPTPPLAASQAKADVANANLPEIKT